MSLILTGLVVAAASGVTVLAGRLLVRRGASRGAPKDPDTPDDPPAATGTADARRPRERLEGFPCQLGDVVMRRSGDEAWLAGALVLSEDVPVAALFFGPDAGKDRIVYATPAPRATVAWLEALDAGDVLVGGEPPTSLEHGGVRFERRRRIPLRARRVGVGALDLGGAVVLAEYASVGADRLVLVKGDAARAFRGVELDEGTYEVIASGDGTLDE